ncbi:hypothetical protein [Mycolicibacterium brumae]|uniref:Uncharacterized protein n=1 Tax=Mycolicibacterium brumae TaxID=85968 RepID=A0A2G5P6J5_9MYCO|nr:hypothetical protein [Mycolicibacterium brumae]MCV7193808.1 hypothetical protein [Mycolicibacterium brumae]PIB73989.1 hypothetical protein CQY22_014570 [Mycolicibacterium brumae]RWA21432.1 hypothetical protein MBRU_14555 [Mycolicibacterium brumae DSM 44177]UWW07359.1 hypothetical protein L2Z93_000364 [Mycolicibacterium brumae]
MSWEQFHERNAFMADLIERATVDAEPALDFTPSQEAVVARLFGDTEQLMLALRHKWLTNLAATLDQASYEGKSFDVAQAELIASRPGLPALLNVGERRFVRLRSLQSEEQKMIRLHGDAPYRTVA